LLIEKLCVNKSRRGLAQWKFRSTRICSAPVTDGERELSMLYSNHSCNPNLGMRGEITFVATRDIRAGEELTHDWAMTDDDEYAVECKCGAANCRKILTGKDWQRPELQKRYAGYFSAYLADKIAMQARLDG
jgi:uncharacterized protein